MSQAVDERLAARVDEIRGIIARSETAFELSAALFAPEGVFATIAPAREERDKLTKSSVFDEAQNRLTELERQEARRFAEALRDKLDPTRSELDDRALVTVKK